MQTSWNENKSHKPSLKDQNTNHMSNKEAATDVSCLLDIQDMTFHPRIGR